MKQCYSTHLQYVVVDQEYVKDAMALVPFNAYVAIDVDKNNLHCTFHLRCFDIHKPVAVKSREAAESVVNILHLFLITTGSRARLALAHSSNIRGAAVL